LTDKRQTVKLSRGFKKPALYGILFMNGIATINYRNECMTRKINRLEDYVPASEAASLISEKLGRRIYPDYIRKLSNVRFHTINAKTRLYYKPDLEQVTIRQKTV
jgi:hypothetical protein